jgi:glycosyltransferase involved in cell wall biosynthesis
VKLISIVTPCFNEEENVGELIRRVRDTMAEHTHYRYEHILIDNASTDRTVEIAKRMAAEDPRVKLIVNMRNFGHIRSPTHAMLQARGDAVIAMASDLQDPPELIAVFIKKWEEGYPLVLGVKPKSQETPLMFLVRRLFYAVIGRIADIRLIPNFTGVGLYDRSFVDAFARLEDPYPYFRGIIAEFGFPYALVTYSQPKRARGITKNNFYTLYDLAMLGITSHSKIPLRLATMFGFVLSLTSFLLAVGYLVAKLLFWNRFQFGTAPLLIGVFFFASVQLLFIGILGEYIAAIHTHTLRRPLVVEKERVNFDQVDYP